MRVPEKMSANFEELLSDDRGIEDKITARVISTGYRRSRERTKNSAVQRLVERRQAQQRARSNSSSCKQKEKTDYHRSLSANSSKTYITIGPGKPTTIRENSPVKKPVDVKNRRSSVPTKLNARHPLYENSTPLKSSGLIKSFTTEKSFEVNKDQKRKLSIDVSEVISRSSSRASPESDSSVSSAESGSAASETVSKRRISLQERFQARATSRTRVSQPEKHFTPRRGRLNERIDTVTTTTTTSKIFFNGPSASNRTPPSRRFSQGNLLRPKGDISDKKPPIASPRKISLQNCHYPTTTVKDKISLADEKKEEGNKLYKLKNYRDALSKYSEAIALCSENSALYGNRSACFMMMGLYPKALEDCRRSISLNPEFIKGYVRLIKCSIIIGDILTANQAIEKVEALDPGSNIVLEEKQSLDRLQSFQINSEQAYNTGDFRTSVYYLDQRLLISSADKSLKIRKAECLVYLGRYEEATKLIFDLLRADSMDVDAIYVRGLCLYYNDEIDKALSHFQQVLKFSPDHQKAKDTFKKAKLLKQKKVEGNSAFRTERLASAHAIYSEALEIDPLNKLINSKIYLNRAIVAAKLDRLRESIEDCDRALEITPTYLKALLRRAKSYMDLGECDDAARDYETLAKIEPSNHEYRLLLQNAQIQSKKLKRKDYYKILGVKKNANDDEIKKAYRKRALVHHPDRHSGASEKERVKHEKIFKEVGEAYGVLSDSQKKSRYDNGADLADIDPSESYRTKIDPERIFQAFFTNGAMGGGGHPFTGAGDFNFTF